MAPLFVQRLRFGLSLFLCSLLLGHILRDGRSRVRLVGRELLGLVDHLSYWVLLVVGIGLASLLCKSVRNNIQRRKEEELYSSREIVDLLG